MKKVAQFDERSILASFEDAGVKKDAGETFFIGIFAVEHIEVHETKR